MHQLKEMQAGCNPMFEGVAVKRNDRMTMPEPAMSFFAELFSA
jgi:hypothetical protein